MKTIRMPRFSNLSIRYKLFASFLVVVSIPFLLLLFIHLNFTQRESKAQALFSSHQVLGETKSYLGYKAGAILEVANFIAFSDLVQESVTADPVPFADINRWHQGATELSDLLNKFRYNQDFVTIQLYMKQGLAAATESPDFLNMGKVESASWYGLLSGSRSAYAWLPASTLGDGNSNNITLLRKIPSAHNIQAFDGIVRAEINPNAFQTVLNHAVITPSASAVLFTVRGEILIASSGFPYTREQLNLILAQRPDHDDPDDYWNDSVAVAGTKVLLGVQAIPNTDMKVALIVPASDLSAATDKARNRLISIFLLVVPLMLPLSFLMAATATKRIRRLIKQVRQVKHGKFQLAELPASEDEIGELTRNFNVMVQDVSRLVEETYTLGREVKNKELKALQAQINPHFLYNTLDLINVLAIESGARDISNVVGELAVFYKLSLSDGRENVTLENELKHAESYVRIQNMRFGGGIRFEIEVPRELYGCIVPKIILQPIVENSVIHGIREKDDERGSIRIAARAEGGNLVIELSDDGVGMDASELDSVMKGGTKRSSGGFGLRNIQERLQLSYGPGYGLEFAGARGEGMRVQIRLPDSREASAGPEQTLKERFA